MGAFFLDWVFFLGCTVSLPWGPSSFTLYLSKSPFLKRVSAALFWSHSVSKTCPLRIGAGFTLHHYGVPFHTQ